MLFCDFSDEEEHQPIRAGVEATQEVVISVWAVLPRRLRPAADQNTVVFRYVTLLPYMYTHYYTNYTV